MERHWIRREDSESLEDFKERCVEAINGDELFSMTYYNEEDESNGLVVLDTEKKSDGSKKA